MKEPNSYGFSSNRITPDAWELLLFTNPSIPIIISNNPGYWFTSFINTFIGFLFLSGFPFITSSNDHKKPRSLGINEDKYWAISTSIPSGYSSLLYPRQAVKIVERVPSVPKVAIKVHPRFFLLKSSISSLKFCPLSSFIFCKINGLLLGHKSKSISPNSVLSLFRYRQKGSDHWIGSSWVIPNK